MSGFRWAPERRAPLPPVQPWSGASEHLVAPADHPWRTPAEASGFEWTPDYATTRAWFERLAAASPLIHVESFGRTAEGREMLLVVASRDMQAALVGQAGGRRRLLAQCGIHPGEIDGKDAAMMLLRDIAFGARGDLLDGVDWYFVPIINIDGHEAASPFNRPNQRGPENQGWRTSAANLNLNRDYMKVDSPEMTAMLALIVRIDPDLYIDLHVSDGLDFQYDITFGCQDAAYAMSPACNEWLERHCIPRLSAALAIEGHVPGPLVLAFDDRVPDAGLYLPAFPPRFSHAYGDARCIPTILVENHALKPVRRRVLGTYVLLAAALEALAADPSAAAAKADDRVRRPARLVTRWSNAAEPVRRIAFRPVAHEYYRSPASGADEIRWLGTPAPDIEVPLYGSVPAFEADLPRAWWIPAAEADAIIRLQRHGIEMETLATARPVEIEVTRFADLEIAPALAERRLQLECVDPMRSMRRITYAPGSVRVPSDQPLGRLAALLLDPSSPDSLFAMGFFAGMLCRTDYLEAYVVAPMADAMLVEDSDLRAAFEAKLAAEPAFAGDPMARLAWFYARTPYADDRYLLYPVAVEPAP